MCWLKGGRLRASAFLHVKTSVYTLVTTVIAEVPHHAIVVLGKGCNVSLMSASLKACFANPIKFCPPQSLTTPMYMPCMHEGYSVHVYVKSQKRSKQKQTYNYTSTRHSALPYIFCHYTKYALYLLCAHEWQSGVDSAGCVVHADVNGEWVLCNLSVLLNIADLADMGLSYMEMVWNITVSFASCLVSFWGFHPYMRLCCLASFFVTLHTRTQSNPYAHKAYTCT